MIGYPFFKYGAVVRSPIAYYRLRIQLAVLAHENESTTAHSSCASVVVR